MNKNMLNDYIEKCAIGFHSPTLYGLAEFVKTTKAMKKVENEEKQEEKQNEDTAGD